ncbi:isopentenyl-diphosphate Delta-isomerase [Streptomyces sp. QH1-20]|uniref:isopentenyl-diphosphate Delta-isomerase n=1 Tax=Streptomyces sp. QH1-20 TaxID=3240934 RepID=UPI0035165BE1
MADQSAREELLVDLVDDEGISVGTATVDAAHRTDVHKHRAFSVMLFDGRGHALIARRSTSKLRFPGVWGPSTCGHPASGVTLTSCGQRRIFEELGVSGVEVHEAGITQYRLGYGDYTEDEYSHVLIGFSHGELNPDPQEVGEVRWMAVDDLTRELKDHPSLYAQWLKPVWEVALPAAQASGMVSVGKDMLRSEREKDVYAYYEFKRADVINTDAGEDDYVHSHFSIFPYNRAALKVAEPHREKAVMRELHRIENLQAQALVDLLGDLPPTARVLDVACGRGGTSFFAYERFGCFVEGIDFSPYRIEYAQKVARQHGIADRVTFEVGNVNATGKPDGYYDAVYINEVAPHLDSVDDLCREVSRVLKPGGVFVFVEWIADSENARHTPEVKWIDRNYYTQIPSRPTVLKAMTGNGLYPRHLEDRAHDVLPYWELRQASKHRTGVESPFYTAFQNGILNYLRIVCDKQP